MSDGRGSKITQPVGDVKMAELARDSMGHDARPTTQMDPAQMRALLGDAVAPIDEIATKKGTGRGMPPLRRPPSCSDAAPPLAPSSSEVVELGDDERKTRMQQALAKPSVEQAPVTDERPADPRPAVSRMTWMLIAALAAVTILAVIGWLR